MKSALVILSGGQDSTTCLFWAKERFEEVHAITFDYGQRHRIEIESAKNVAIIAGVKTHEIVNVEGLLKSTSPLTSDNIPERYDDFDQMVNVIGDRVELTFVPLRNPLFMLIAANRALAIGCNTLVTGICQEDNANYPDCTNQFANSFGVMVNDAIGDFGRIIIETPLMFMSKEETVRMATKLPGCWGALAFSHTGYDGVYPPVDKNHSNVLRAYGFEKAGFPDPLVIRAWLDGLMSLPDTPNYKNGYINLGVKMAILAAAELLTGDDNDS